MSKNILIFGANSDIMQEFARINALEESNNFFLIGRDIERIKILKDDLIVRGAKSVDFLSADLSEIKNIENIMSEVSKKFSIIDVCIIAQGSLTNQIKAENDIDYFFYEARLNSLSYMCITLELIKVFGVDKIKNIVFITSVAGDRIRQSNYIYGTFKSSLSSFLSGLRHKYYNKEINFIEIKPGFTKTKMTKEFKKNLLWSEPSVIANDIKKAILHNKKVVYSPFWWKFIMLIIKLLPTFIFNKLKI